MEALVRSTSRCKTRRTPLTPDQRCKLQLAMVPGIGSGRFQKILKHVSSPARLLAYQTRDWLQIPGIGTQIAEQLSNRFQEIRLESLLQQCDAHDIGICLLGDCDYPLLLAEIHDPPPVIFWQGKQSLLAQRAIAVVGSRRSTQYGDSITRSLVSDLIRTDLAVVSGLARGIDRVAHEVALEKGGATLAVIASGHGVIYPPEHHRLYEEIACNGLVISEHPPGVEIKSRHFPQRNRIIAGLSLGVIVVEAAERSGALITVRHALEQNREVFAVPGRVGDPASKGCLNLIRDGAKLTEVAADVLEELPLQAQGHTFRNAKQETDLPPPVNLEEREKNVLEMIGSKREVDIDSLLAGSSLAVHEVLAALAELELQGLIQSGPGGTVRLGGPSR